MISDNNNKKNKMKITELTIGTKVSYTRTSLTSDPVDLQSVVKGFFDGYVCLENGDKMSRSALTVIEDNSDRIKQLEDRLFRLKANGRHLQNSITINATEELLKTLK